MRGGRLRHRVIIEAQREVRNADGDVVGIAWETFLTEHDDAGNEIGVAAEIAPLSARELMAAQATQSEVSAKITIRSAPGVSADMRVRRLDDGRVYNIAGVIEDNRSGREWITLPVTQGVNDG